jgi:CPA1 family monovalent cation:H+ antiporter
LSDSTDHHSPVPPGAERRADRPDLPGAPMTPFVEIVLVLLVAVVVIAAVARRLRLPEPILFVLAGVGLGLVPGFPHIELEPELVFLLVLPPILYAAGYFTSIRDFKANLRPIGLLAIGLVIFTTVIVAIVAKALVPTLTWPMAFILGAIVSPPDAVAATAIFRRLGVPRRVVTILEGESLVNDATALVAYRFAVAALLTGSFSVVEATGTFVFVAVGGFAVGIVLALAGRRIWQQVDDPPIEITLSILYPLVSYVVAEKLGVSGVIATVTAGVIAGRDSARVMSSATRIQGQAAWNILLFVINGVIFLIIGLQLPLIVGELRETRSTIELVALAAAVSLAAIVARLVWVFPGAYLPRILSSRIRDTEPHPPRRNVFVVAWAGIRGVVTIAAAFALPLTYEDGGPFEERGLIVFLAFSVMASTLVLQGLSLPWLVRRLDVLADDSDDREEAHARQVALEAALGRIVALREEWPDHVPLIEHLEAQYTHRSEHTSDRDGPEDEVAFREKVEHRDIRRAVIAAEREAVILLRDGGTITDEVLRRVERDLDLEELRMEA